MAKKQTKIKKVSTAQPQGGWLFKAIVFLGMLLMTIGIFGTILINKPGMLNGTESEAINFKWFFDVIDKCIKAGGSKNTFESTFETSSYISIGIFFFAILVTLIPTLVMFLKQKKNINVKKTFAFASVGSLLYLFANTIFWCRTAGTSLGSTYISAASSSFGWGAILIIVGFVLGLAGILLFELFTAKSFISLRNIFAKVGLVLMFFIGIFSAYGLKQSYSEGSISANASYSIFSAIAFLTLPKSEVGSGPGSAAIVFSIVSMVFFALTLYKFIFNNPNKKGNSIIVFASIFFVSALVSNICISSFGNAIKEAEEGIYNISLGSGAIVELVLGFGVIVAAILTRIFRKTDKEVA